MILMQPSTAPQASASPQPATAPQTVLPLDRGGMDRPSLEQAGGTAASLVRMAAAGLPVPPGFVLATEAYRQFVTANDFETMIVDAIRGLSEPDPGAWERAAATIHGRFAQAAIPDDLASAVRAAYA